MQFFHKSFNFIYNFNITLKNIHLLINKQKIIKNKKNRKEYNDKYIY